MLTGMASPTDAVATAAAADDPATGLRGVRALSDLADRLEVLQVRAARGRSEAAGSTGADELVELLVAARTA